ncbi:hypothetical protein WMF30_11695 [Sorangium sp. So ce134]
MTSNGMESKGRSAMAVWIWCVAVAPCIGCFPSPDREGEIEERTSTSSGAGSTQGAGSGASGSGGSGGSTGSAASIGAGSSTSIAATGATSSTAAGTPACDDETDTCGSDTNTGCFKCAMAGPCYEFREACLADDDCIALFGCVGDCSEEDDPASCIEECRMDHETAVEIYDAIAKCTICEQCAYTCDAANEPVCQS